MIPHYKTEHATLYVGDCIAVMAALPANSVDAVVTDPPYGLEFMGRDWDGADGFRRSLNDADAGRDSVFGRTSRTSPEYKTVGQISTGDEIRGAYAYGGTHSRGYADNDVNLFGEWCRRWALEAHRVLKPGGHLLAFGGTRTWHRLTVGIEDAGFEIRDALAWIYGQGFPKSLDVAKAIDKGHASARERALDFTAWMRSTGIPAAWINDATASFMATHFLTQAQQPEIATAAQFALIRPYFDQHGIEIPEEIEELVRLRTGESFPSWQAREVTGEHAKAAPGQIWQENVLGAPADGPKERRDLPHTPEAAEWEGWGTALKPAFEPIVFARKPLDGTVASNVLAHGTGALNVAEARVGSDPRDPGRWPSNVLLDQDAAAALDEQAPQAGASGRASVPTLEGRTDASVAYGARNGLDRPAIFHDDNGGASRFFHVFKYEPKATTAERPKVDGQAHPTVKPVPLMRWMIRLVVRRGGVVLDPFAGSGTTGEAALAEGDDVILIERDPVYVPLIERRLTRTADTLGEIVTARAEGREHPLDGHVSDGALF